MDKEVWLDVTDIATAVGITARAVQKRLPGFITRKIPGVGRSGTRYQLLLSSLPEPWQAAYRARLAALPEPWRDAVLAKAEPNSSPAPDPSFAGAVPASTALVVAGSIATDAHAVAVASSSRALAPAAASDDTTYIKEWQRRALHARLALLQDLDRRMLAVGVGRAMVDLIDDARAGRLPAELQAQIPLALARGDAALSVRTLNRWLEGRAKGLSLLVPRARERGQRVPPWAHALLKAWQQPQKPALTWALARIAEPGALPDGVEPPSESAARRFLAKLHAVDRQRGRMGPRELKNIRPYRVRDASGLWPAEVYTMDGHTFDAEVAHPFHGQPFRPEITACLDVATRRLVGWSVALAESALAVLDALRHSVQVGGIPAILYVDNGTGYANALMEDQAVGFMARLGITKQHSLPYNSQARGAIERAHRSIWVKLAKTMPTYMGDAMDKEARNRAYKLTRQEIKAAGSSRLLPAWSDFVAACEIAAADYNARPHAALPKIVCPLTGQKRHQSPDELWAELIRQNPDCLEPVAEADLADLFRPYKTAKIVRGWVRLFGNRYFHADLTGHHEESAFVGYDIHDASRVWVRDRNQRLIAVALINGNSAPYFGTPAVEVAAIGRAKARESRLERRLDEVRLELAGGRPALEGRLATPEEAAAARDYLADLAEQPTEPPAPPAVPEPSPEPAPVAGRPRVFESDLDLWRWVNDHPEAATDRDRAWIAACLEDDEFQRMTEAEAQKKSRANAA